MELNKVLSLVGLATRANKTISGFDAVVLNLEKNTVYVILLAKDSALNTRKKIERKAQDYGVPCFSLFSQEELSRFLGKPNRGVCGVIDENFAKGILDLLNDGKKEQNGTKKI